MLERIAGRFRPRRVARGAYLFLAGEPATALHLLASGRVKIVSETDDAREVILRLIGPCQIFVGRAAGARMSTPPPR